MYRILYRETKCIGNQNFKSGGHFQALLVDAGCTNIFETVLRLPMKHFSSGTEGFVSNTNVVEPCRTWRSLWPSKNRNEVNKQNKFSHNVFAFREFYSV